VSMPTFFWFRVTRELLMGTLFAAVFISILVRLGPTTLAWLFAGYAAVYVTLILVTLHRRHP